MGESKVDRDDVEIEFVEPVLTDKFVNKEWSSIVVFLSISASTDLLKHCISMIEYVAFLHLEKFSPFELGLQKKKENIVAPSDLCRLLCPPIRPSSRPY